MKNGFMTVSSAPKLQPLYLLLILQGGYFFLTGIWPILHIESFIAVTGPKEDIWLVKTVGMVITCVGAGFLVGGLLRNYEWPLVVIAILSPLGFIIVDVHYVSQDVISPIYLADAVVELLFLLSWVILLLRNATENKAVT